MDSRTALDGTKAHTAAGFAGNRMAVLALVLVVCPPGGMRARQRIYCCYRLRDLAFRGRWYQKIPPRNDRGHRIGKRCCFRLTLFWFRRDN